jgi:manganese/iron transport system substrate-binding protein
MLTYKLFSKLLPGAIATTTMVLTGCQTQINSFNSFPNSQALAQAKPKIVVSHSVLCDFMTTIARDTVDLTCLIGGGEDPHAYRPTPSQRKVLEEARVIFYGGYNYETSVIPLIEAVDENVPKIAVHEAVVTDPIMTEHDRHEAEYEPEGEANHENHEAETKQESAADPHIWHDVYNAIAMIEYLQSSLLQLNPSQAAVYLENSAKLIEELKQLHVWIQKQIATIPEEKRILVTTHDSLNYYVQTYEIKQYLALQGLSPDDSPSASDLRNLVQEIRQTQVPTIFAETTANDRVIKSVAREAGVKISDRQLLVDSLGKAGTDTDTYRKMMIHNTCAIVDGLGGKCQP